MGCAVWIVWICFLPPLVWLGGIFGFAIWVAVPLMCGGGEK